LSSRWCRRRRRTVIVSIFAAGLKARVENEEVLPARGHGVVAQSPMRVSLPRPHEEVIIAGSAAMRSLPGRAPSLASLKGVPTQSSLKLKAFRRSRPGLPHGARSRYGRGNEWLEMSGRARASGPGSSSAHKPPSARAATEGADWFPNVKYMAMNWSPSVVIVKNWRGCCVPR